ncbi:MAG: HAD-IIIA family hydrolase [Verrucomicrobiota bacterium]
MVTQLLILAGGKGTRLAAVAGDLPKPLVPVGGRPLLAHHLDLARRHGLRSVRIFAGYRAEQIADFVRNHPVPGLDVLVTVESEPLGTAGAVIEQMASLEEQFVVLYGDTLVGVDLGRMVQAHETHGADITLLAYPNDHPHDSDLLEASADGWITCVHRYPHPADSNFGNMVNRALYVVRRDALTPWAGRREKADFAKDVFPRLLATGRRLLAYRSKEYIKDMGTPERLAAVDRDWRAGKLQLDEPAGAEPAVFLDRDGTLNVEKGFLRRAEDLELFPGVAPALRALRQAGYRLVVLTNQPVLARGEATEADLARIHARMEWLLGQEGAFVDAIYHCPHHPDRGFPGERPELKGPCHCRKPAPGMLERACAELGLDPARSWMIGDSTGDILLANRTGVRAVLVRTGQAGRDGKYPAAQPGLVAENLPEAVAEILKLSPPA